MVKVTPVNENEKQYADERAAAAAADDEDYSDTESELSDAESDDEDVEDETFTDRLVALRDIVPPQYRSKLASSASSTYNWITSGFTYGAKAAWVVTTSGLLLAVPLALSIVSEQQLMEMEKDVKMAQSANDVMAPGAESGFAGANEQQQQQQQPSSA